MGLGFYQTASVHHAAERVAIRKHTEHAAGMHEAHAPPERAPVATERVEEPREGLRGVHGVEHDPLEPRELEHDVELFASHRGPSDALIAVEQAYFGRRPDRETEAAARAFHHVDDVGADALALPRDRDPDDFRAQAGQLLGHQQSGLAAAAEIRDGDRVELRGAVADLLRELLPAREIAE